MSTRSVSTAIKVLEAVAEYQPIGLSVLSRHLEIPKATVHRTLLTLEELGWLARTDPDSGKWTITIHAYVVASSGSSGSKIRDAAMGPLNALQLDTAETVHLAVPDGPNMVVIERLDTPHPLRTFLALGSRVPMHASATGLAYLAALADNYLEEYLQHLLEASTPFTLVDPQSLRAEITRARSQGFVLSEQGLSAGITSLGAVLLGREAHPVGSISISGPSSRITAERYEEYGKAISQTALKISRALSRQQ